MTRKSNKFRSDNKSTIKGSKKMPSTIPQEKEKDFEKSKLRNKGKGSNENLGGSLNDQKGLNTRKRRLF